MANEYLLLIFQNSLKLWGSSLAGSLKGFEPMITDLWIESSTPGNALFT